MEISIEIHFFDFPVDIGFLERVKDYLLRNRIPIYKTTDDNFSQNSFSLDFIKSNFIPTIEKHIQEYDNEQQTFIFNGINLRYKLHNSKVGPRVSSWKEFRQYVLPL